jgi:hypothetical protein
MKSPKLFIGVFPTGLGYADSSREEDGDYVKVAFLPYSTLELEVYKPKSALLPEIREHAAGMQAKRGESFSVSTCGQSVVLGQK